MLTDSVVEKFHGHGCWWRCRPHDMGYDLSAQNSVGSLADLRINDGVGGFTNFQLLHVGAQAYGLFATILHH